MGRYHETRRASACFGFIDRYTIVSILVVFVKKHFAFVCACVAHHRVSCFICRAKCSYGRELVVTGTSTGLLCDRTS